MIVMDDEKYFTYYCDRIPGTDGFFTGNIDLCSRDSLNYISCFKFEIYMQKLKCFVRKADNPVVQVANRLVIR